jgi:hypothetical protein
MRRDLFIPLSQSEEPAHENQNNDASLSVAIGGTTGFFVGTDAAYLLEQNWLIGAVGIQRGSDMRLRDLLHLWVSLPLGPL